MSKNFQNLLCVLGGDSETKISCDCCFATYFFLVFFIRVHFYHFKTLFSRAGFYELIGLVSLSLKGSIDPLWTIVMMVRQHLWHICIRLF